MATLCLHDLSDPQTSADNGKTRLTCMSHIYSEVELLLLLLLNYFKLHAMPVTDPPLYKVIALKVTGFIYI